MFAPQNAHVGENAMQDFRITRRFMLAGTALGAATLAANPALAQAAGGDGKIFPFPTHVKDLRNGLRVIVIETGFPDVVSVQIPVSVGSRNEVEPGKSGFAHFFEHMMFRGTPTMSATEYQAVLTAIGADSNAYTSDDLTNYHTTFNKEDLETVLRMEADRFMNLSYSEADFRTEARAVLGEYNKNIANPISKLLEVMRNTHFQRHTYKHTTMGFIEDIEAMPEQFDYSRQFFARYYRPQTTTIIIAGDVKPGPAFALAEKYWGKWEAGTADVPEVPVEPAPNGPQYAHVPWATETLTWVAVAFRGPAAYPAAGSPDAGDQQVLDVIQSYAFSPASPIYQKLVVREQKVEGVGAFFPDRVDPWTPLVFAQVKDKADAAYVRDELQKELARLRANAADPARIDAIRSALKYGFAAGLDSTDAIAGAVAPYVAATRTVETLNEVYRRYDKVTAEDIRRVANKYFTDQRMIVTTLAHGDLPEAARSAGSVDAHVAAVTAPAGAASAAVAIPPRPARANPPQPAFKELIQPSVSPLIDVRMVFATGAADDPPGKEGLAALTAMMVTQAGSRSMTYEQIQQALFPMAAGFGSNTDKEMTVFAGTVHRDNLERWYDVVAGQLLDPGFREEDFTRVKTSLINGIRNGLRGNNDEELGNEVLYEQLYAEHPYGHLNAGHVDAIEKLTVEDVRKFHWNNYTQSRLTLGVAGGATPAFLARARADLASSLQRGVAARRDLPAPRKPSGLDVTLVQKDTRAAAISMGFPIEVARGHPDFVALNLVRSWFGEHRSSSAYLYGRIREIRGMNYGDYAYTEYFPGGMFTFQPPPNVARSQQAFRIWIRPVPPEHAHFAIRIAKYELDKLVRDGMTQANFDATRQFLNKSTGLLVAQQGRRLGYALDQRFHGVDEDFTRYIRDGLKDLTLEKVNAAIRKHLGGPDMAIVVVTPQAEPLRVALVADAPSPMTYASPKPDDIVEEDKVIAVYPLALDEGDVRIVPVGEVFEKDLFD